MLYPSDPAQQLASFAFPTDKTEAQLGFHEEKEPVEQKPRKVSDSQVRWLCSASPPGSFPCSAWELGVVPREGRARLIWDGCLAFRYLQVLRWRVKSP